MLFMPFEASEKPLAKYCGTFVKLFDNSIQIFGCSSMLPACNNDSQHRSFKIFLDIIFCSTVHFDLSGRTVHAFLGGQSDCPQQFKPFADFIDDILVRVKINCLRTEKDA